MPPPRAKTFSAGLVQFDSRVGDVDANLAAVAAIIEEHRGRVDLLVFPELTLTGYSVGERAYDTALRLDDPRFAALLEASAGITVALGLIEETPTYRFFNSLVFLRDGQLVHSHRKINLPNYGIFEERKYFSVGPRYRCVDIDGCRLAPFVCGDAWSPPLVHLAAAEGAEVLVFSVCSPRGGLGSELSTETGWQLASRFYATMYGAYVIFVNRVGKERDLTFWGQSELIDPFGRRVAGAEGDAEGVTIAEIDLGLVRRARTTLHTVRDDDLELLRRHVVRLIEQKDTL
jgi:predicted amidohydrolase